MNADESLLSPKKLRGVPLDARPNFEIADKNLKIS